MQKKWAGLTPHVNTSNAVSNLHLTFADLDVNIDESFIITRLLPIHKSEMKRNDAVSITSITTPFGIELDYNHES